MREKLSAFDLKIIALVFMVLDHVNTAFGYNLGLPKWVHFLGRFVAPLFLYLLMEGFKYTSNRKKYLSRLFIVAMVMHAINIIRSIMTKDYIHPMTGQFDAYRLLNGYNIFWTLFLLLGLFMVFDKIKVNKIWIIHALLMLPLIAFSEGGMYLLPIALACYYFNNDAVKVSGFIFVWSLGLLSWALFNYFTSMQEITTLYDHLAFSSEFLMMTSIPFILAYNGKRGGSGKKWEKNLFYIIYPLHLVIIYIITWALKIY